MNKRELTTRVRRLMGAGASHEAAQAAVAAVLESILQEATEVGKVHIAHLGTFEYIPHHKRDGRGLPCPSPAPAALTHRLRFRPAKRLREGATGARRTRTY